MKVTNLRQAASNCRETWSPMIIADVNDTMVKVARVEGEFVWHEHEREDEAFLVLQGELTISYQDHDVLLKVGDFHVVPRGVKHRPKAEEECLIALIEQNTTAHTGKTQTPMTRSLEEQRQTRLKTEAE